MRILRALFAVALLALVVGAPVPASGAEVTVTISSGLEPRDAVVAPGTTVTWVNADGARHRVRSASFDSGNLEPGERFSFTFAAEGRATYVDDRDRNDAAYHGSVTVTGSGSSPGSGSGPGSTPTSPPAAGGGPADVVIGDRVFTPSSLVIAPGGTVTWTNRDGRSHTATADGGAFDTGTLGTGATSTKTFPDEGTFTYVCEIHPDMTGVVRVSAAPATAPPAPPAPPAPAAAPAPAPPAAATGSGPATRNISMADFAFSPATVDARVGDTLVWANAGRAPHTATGSAFDSGRVPPRGTFRFTTTATGTFAYGCTIHPEMTGTIRVAPASAPAPATVRPAATPAAEPANPANPAPTRAADPPDAAGGPPASEAGVEAQDLRFAPATVRIAPGGTVTWTLTGKAPHSVTGDGFDSGILEPGATFAHTFGSEGTYAYACLVHPSMTGTVEVARTAATPKAEAAAAAPPASAAGTRRDPSGDAQAWTIALLGGGGILAATGLLLTGARRFLLAS